MILIQYTFCQMQRISPNGLLAFRFVCALKKKSGVHTQPWLCEWETNSGSGRFCIDLIDLVCLVACPHFTENGLTNSHNIINN